MIRYERDASFQYVKEVFKRLNHKDSYFVNPRGRFVDSPNVAIRYVAFDEDLRKPVGFIDGYVFEDAPDTVILVIAVLEKYRKQHVGSELLSYMERAASQDGYYRLLARIESDNLPSIQMTKKHGFTHDGSIDPDDPQVHMHKILRKGEVSMDRFGMFYTMIANEAAGIQSAETPEKALRQKLIKEIQYMARHELGQIKDQKLKSAFHVLNASPEFIDGKDSETNIIEMSIFDYAKAIGEDAHSLRDVPSKTNVLFDILGRIGSNIQDAIKKKNYGFNIEVVNDGSWDYSYIGIKMNG